MARIECIKLAKEILEHLFNQDPYADECDHRLHDLSRQLCDMIISEPQNLVWITREEAKEFSELQQASMNVDSARQEQREKDALVIEANAVFYWDHNGEQIAQVLEQIANEIRNGG